MTRRLLQSLLIIVPLAASAVALALSSCNSTTSPVGIAQGCTINSDCASPLACVFGRCHEACSESRDCPAGERCVASGADKVCELPQDNACSASQPCPGALVCTSDQCRNSCSSDQPCPGAQLCVSGACFDPTEVDAGPDAAPDVAQLPDASDSDAACVPAVSDAGLLGYKTSNFDLAALAITDGGANGGQDGGLNLATPSDISIVGVLNSLNSVNALGKNWTTITLSDKSQAYLWVVGDFTVASGAQLNLTSDQLTYPLIIASLGKVDIQGDIVATGLHANGSAVSGAGGNPEYGVSAALGPGAGGGGYSIGYPNSASGGGSFCGTGGNGSGTGLIAPGGSFYGDPTLVPLYQSSAGGYAYQAFYPGFSGGSLQISARTSITVRNSGSINVGGGGGYGGGGGAGGAILLEAPTLTIQGRLAANGGSGGAAIVNVSYTGTGTDGTANDTPAPGGGRGGAAAAGATINGTDGTSGDGGTGLDNGGGGGGAGYIRLNSACGATISGTAIISPYVTTKCSTQGTVK